MKISKVKCRFRYSDFCDDWEKIELDREKNCIYIEKNIWNTKLFIYPPENEINSFFKEFEKMLSSKELNDDFYSCTASADFGFYLTVINDSGNVDNFEFHTNNYHKRYVKVLWARLYNALGYCFPKAITQYPKNIQQKILKEKTKYVC